MTWIEWYDSLAKPGWTPAPATIGLIWQILYPIILVTFGFVFVQALRPDYVVNSDPDGIDHGLNDRPMLAFALCYIAAHLALDLLDERQADAILTYCEGHLNELEAGA